MYFDLSYHVGLHGLRMTVRTGKKSKNTSLSSTVLWTGQFLMTYIQQCAICVDAILAIVKHDGKLSFAVFMSALRFLCVKD